MFTLGLLGGAGLTRDGSAVDGPVMQRRRLGLLALLAVPAGRTLSRDKLIAYLWPESGSEQARHLLSEALYVVRKALGENAVAAPGDELRLNAAVIATDVEAFERALADDRLEQALALYHGPFLDGFFIADAPEFERWAERERVRLATAHQRALESFATRNASKGDGLAAVDAWRKLVQLDPFSSRYALRYMEALAAIGDRPAALQHARLHAVLLREEFEAEADPEISVYAEKLRADPDLRPVHGARAPPAARGDPGLLDSVVPPPAARPLPSRDEPRLPVAEEVSAERGAARRPVVRHRLMAAVLLAGLTGWLIWGSARERDARDSRDAAPLGGVSVAVLPFVDLSPTRDQEWLGDGLADQLIRELGSLPDFRVLARTSSFAFRGSDAGAAEIGRQLGASHLVEGSVRLSGDLLRVASLLIDAGDGIHVWSQTYDRRVTDLSAVQDEIVRAIVAGLGVQLAATPTTPPSDPAADTLYLQGRFFWNRRDPEGLERAIELFEQAVQLKPEHALAHAGLADAYALLVTLGALAPAEGYALAWDAAERALAADPSLPEGHATLALVRLYLLHDWDGAEREFRRALEVHPDFATGHHWYAQFLGYRGDSDSAMRAIQLALELDPLSPAVHTAIGTLHYYARRYDAAEAQLRRVLAEDPTFLVARLWLGATYLQQRRFGAAEAEAREAARLAPDHPLPTTLLGYVYAASGRDDDARRLLAELREMSARRYVSPAYEAALQVALGDHDAAFSALEHAYRLRDDWVVYLRVEPAFDPLRDDPRFDQLLARVGP